MLPKFRMARRTRGRCSQPSFKLGLQTLLLSPPPLLRIVPADILYISTSKQMSRLTSVLTMFLAFLAGNAIGLPAELATHSAKVNATNRVALDQVRESIETNEANNGTVPATVSVRGQDCVWWCKCWYCGPGCDKICKHDLCGWKDC